MIISNELLQAIDKQLYNVKISDLQKVVSRISDTYREESANNAKIVITREDVLAYIGTRMPATYGAVFTALAHTLDIANVPINTLLDAGSGTGAGVWACLELCSLDSITCIEREQNMINVGRDMLSSMSLDIEWRNLDLANSDFDTPSDIVICAYALNEMDDANRRKVIAKLWKNTKKILLIVEPGTPIASRKLQAVREEMLDIGANIIAPCPHDGACTYTGNDWCHFACRVPRSKLHMQLKKAEVPYEDEKFSYIAFSRGKFETSQVRRVLRHPIISKGTVELEVCGMNGISRLVLKKKDGALYKLARKADTGDTI